MENSSFLIPETPRGLHSRPISQQREFEDGNSSFTIPSSPSSTSSPIMNSTNHSHNRPPRPRTLSSSSTDEILPKSHREAVQWTCEDAAACKLSSVQAGYYSDDFIHHFTRRTQHKAPVINRGYYARKMAIDMLIARFLEVSGPCQIISLGAGLDTRYFSMRKQHKTPSLYIELDYTEVVAKKCNIIQKNIDAFSTVLDTNYDINTHEAHPFLRSSSYKLLAADLEQPDEVIQLLKNETNVALPTLFVSECVLIYMDADVSDTLLRNLSSAFLSSVFVTYEQITPDDPFGKMMLRNLEAQHLPLKGISKYPTVQAQQHRYLQLGWQNALASTMDDVFIKHIQPMNAPFNEILDELEEWHLMSKHYVLVYASKDPLGRFSSFGFPSDA